MSFVVFAPVAVAGASLGIAIGAVEVYAENNSDKNKNTAIGTIFITAVASGIAGFCFALHLLEAA